MQKLNSILKIKSDTENLILIREFVLAHAVKNGFSDEATNDIMLAADEAATNIMKHSYKSNSSGIIEVRIDVVGDEFEIILKDKGRSFNPNDIPSPNMEKYFSEKRVGGLGLHLMRTLMDSVEYSAAESGNKLILKKKLKKVS